jgi:hypothetical protein
VLTMPQAPDRKIEDGESMTYKELQAMQVAYELLTPLDPSAQQRVMTWLSAALTDTTSGPTAIDEPAATVKPVAEVPAHVAPGDNVVQGMAEHEAAVPEAETAAPAVRGAEVKAAAEPELAVEPQPMAEPAADPRPRRRRSAKATGRRATKADRSAPAVKPSETAPGPRSDRPNGDQFLADLAATGSFKALAEKYSKSIGTIGNWANHLREQGFDIPVGRQKRT